MRKNHAFATGVGLVICVSAACSAEPKAAPSEAPAIAPLAEATFIVPVGPKTRPGAVTYDPKLVPAGASA
ncbi:hypothetical protein SAMN04489729_7082 [Amycolatopsis lurida]|nr:hypothetical protein SAMN04489729_7082 [Amycolatopsis lurida]